ncbi:MAG TPA: hypothetical protein P5311_00855 [Candidatus Dojkabacteria bacterium]|nr:hypothetical protein [Candidatus Dojkabacteria bacterium]
MDNSLLLSIIILLLIVALFVMVSLNTKKIDQKKREKLIKELYSLEKSIISEELAVRRDAIIKLDNILSKSLQLYFKNDSSCGENLKSAGKIFRKREYNRLWEAHKIRNKIVHDDYAVSKEEAREALQIYKLSVNKILK